MEVLLLKIVGGIFVAAVLGSWGWIWKTDRRVVRLEAEVKDLRGDLDAAKATPCAEVVEMRGAVKGLIRAMELQHEELRDVWPRLDKLTDTLGETNTALAKLEGSLGA